MKAARVLAEILRRSFKPKDVLPAANWVEREVRLDARTSHLAGRYSLRHTPYLRQIYDDVSNPRVRKIVVKKAAQTGLTQLASNVLLYYIGNFTLPALMILPSKELAQAFCERSLTPSIHNCTALKPYLTGNPDDLKKTEFLFNSCIVRVIGAGSPAKLSSNPAALVIVDECDKGEDFGTQGEAPALELAEDRTISFPNDKKILVLSTPTEENTSIVHAQYLLGSQSKYFVSCPHCHAEQVLKFEQIKWPKDCKDSDGNYDLDRIEREAFYECEHCRAHLTELDKLNMVRDGKWKDTNPKPFPAEIRSYHISALYSFNITFGGLAKLFLLSKDDAGKLRNFKNSYLGECWEPQAAELLKPTLLDDIAKQSSEYKKGEIPKRPVTVLMGVDTQGHHFWFVTEAVFNDGSSAVIDWGQAATFQDLAIVANRQYRIRDSDDFVGVYKGLIDAAYKTDEVYQFCSKTGFRFIPTFGRSEKQGLFTPIRQGSVLHRGASIPTVQFNDRHFKDVLLLGTLKEKSPNWLLPRNIDDEFKTQLTSERLVEKKNQRGQIVTEWRVTNRNNHLSDCCKMLVVFRQMLEPLLKQAPAEQEEPEETPPHREYELKPYPAIDWD